MTGRLALDLHCSLRGLARSRAFTVAAVSTLALGIAAVATVFAFVDAIVLSPLPYRDAEELVAVGHTATGVGLEGAGLSGGTYLHYRRHARSLAGLAMYHESIANLGGDDGAAAERVEVAVVTHDLFAVLGARPLLGRLPTAADAIRGGEPVALLGHDLWRRRYGADPGLVGTTVAANGVQRRVIGVLEPGFAFPRPEVGLWLPLDPDPATARAADLYNHGVGRLRPGVTPATAAAELDRLIPALPAAFPDLTPQVIAESRLRSRVVPLAEEVVGPAGAALWLLLGGMALLLLIACANVANLFLLRGEHRRQEVALRTALGARGHHLAGVFFTESLLLALAGAAGGLALAAAATRGLVAGGFTRLPRLDEVALGGRVVALAVALATIAAAALAWLPLGRRGGGCSALAWGASRVAGGGRLGVRRALVAAQVALALTLLVGAGLLAESLWRLARADPGFAAEGVLTAEIGLPRSGYEGYAETERFWTALVERVEALPGVVAAAVVGGLPLVPEPAFHDLAVTVEERPLETRAALTVHHATPGYFSAIGIPLLAGRGPAEAEVDRPLWLSAAAARKLFPAGDAVGKRLRRSVAGEEVPWATVAGVVGDVPRERLGGEPAAIVYLPLTAAATDPGLRPGHGALVVRATVPPSSLVPLVRAVLRDADPHVPLAAVRTLDEVVAASAWRTRFAMLLLGVAAAAALGLGGIGLYGVVAAGVERRSRELAIRVALGATHADLRNGVLGDGLRPTLAGIAAGIAAAAGLTRFLRGLLYEVSPVDPRVFAATVAFLLAVALLAAWLPARRAAAADPLRALRGE